MSSKSPTPQGISALLRKAGFERGVSNPPEQACDGFAVIPNRPGDGVVLVAWWSAGADGGIRHLTMLERYSEAIERAGYRARPADDGTYLIVTAQEDSR
jgi:hypothetical protein